MSILQEGFSSVSFRLLNVLVGTVFGLRLLVLVYIWIT